MQWSRRFIGLPMFMALASLGQEGYAAMVERQCDCMDEFRSLLRHAGWEVINETVLPIVCFTHPKLREMPSRVSQLETLLKDTTPYWLSTVSLGRDKTRAMRACVNSFRTTNKEIHGLMDTLTACLDMIA